MQIRTDRSFAVAKIKTNWSRKWQISALQFSYILEFLDPSPILFKFAFPGKFLQNNRNVTDLLLPLWFLTNLPICNLFFAILCNLFFVNSVYLFFWYFLQQFFPLIFSQFFLLFFAIYLLFFATYFLSIL